MKNISYTAGLLAFILAVALLNLEIIPAIIISIIAGIACGNLFVNGKIIALDLGGVMLEGDHYVDKLRLNNEMTSIVRKLRKRNRVVLLSNQNAVAHDAIEKKLGLRNIFDSQVVSGRIGLKKPDSRYFEFALKKFGAKPKDIIFVDDSPENILAAQKMGINSIQFRSPIALRAELRKRGIAI